MKFSFITAFFLFILIPFFFSCSVSKPTYYFKDIKRDTIINNTSFNLEALKIKQSDILNISISSLSKEEDAIFSRLETLSAGTTGTSAAAGFPVDDNGNIHLHKLGKIKVAGLTREELKNELEKQLLPYLRDPVVAVSFANHYITVMGEVGRPQLLNMPDERMSVTDMIAQSGNTTPVAQLDNLMIIRDHGGSKEFRHINLEDNSIFTSPWYYLQPNDVVVVNPDEKRVLQQTKRERYQQTATIILQALSVIIIITQLFRN